MNVDSVRRIIECKRDGGRIDSQQWRELILEFAHGSVDEAQMAALAMACVFHGLDREETVAITGAMIESGERIDLGLDTFVVDKHSSGGVGDTVSLIVVPVVAACGVHVSKVSGRALGHTGGTLDKFEAIPGVRTEIDPPEFARIVREVGCAIGAQSERLVPADKAFYALRDRTATVPSAGLITASIVSKKIASGADAIVYDVKFGNGAFMKDLESAWTLARTLVAVTEGFGPRASAVISDMNQPLAPAVGSGLEAIEARDYLRGERRDPRLHELIVAVAGSMLSLAGHDPGGAAAALAGAGPYDRFTAMVEAQGGSLASLESLRPASGAFAARSGGDGYVSGVDTAAIGELARTIECRGIACGGIRLDKRIGDRIRRDEPLGSVFGGDAADAQSLARAFSVGPDPVLAPQLVVETVSGSSARSTPATR